MISTDDCWLWAGPTNGYGYGYIRHEGKMIMAHRLMYESEVGKIPEGLYCDHLCRVRNCVNPEHIEPVSNAANVLRGIAPSAQNSRKTHCKNGHEYSGDNLVLIRPNHRKDRVWRRCRTCINANSNKRYWQLKERQV